MKLFDKEFIITQTIKRTNKNIYLRVKNNEIVISTPRKLSDNQIIDIIWLSIIELIFKSHIRSNFMQKKSQMGVSLQLFFITRITGRLK